MMLTWSEDIIRLMEDASAVSDYFEKLADAIEPYIENCSTICDAGCGIGQLASELGKRGYTVYACDRSKSAIDYIKSRNYENVIPVLCDLDVWTPEVRFDAMIFNYFGSMDQILRISERCCRGQSITLKKNYRFHRFSFTEKPINGHMAETAEQYLERNGIKYIRKEFTSEFGQPFRSLDDAVSFFAIYSKDDDRSIICRENVVKLLKKTDLKGFEYYLPKEKPSLMFVTGEKYNGNSL